MRGTQNKQGVSYKRDVVGSFGELALVALAGTPGNWGSRRAAYDCRELTSSSIVANPGTAWTTGQYVELTNGTQAFWDGSAWVCGLGVEAASTGGQTSSQPCDNMPSQSASKVKLLLWLDEAGVDIDDPANLTKAELRSFIDDFCSS